jgi:hypothetical protein
MKKLFFLLVFLALGQLTFAQLKFLNRFEIPSGMRDPLFEISNIDGGLVSFRTVPTKGLTQERKLQYFVSDSNLNSSGIIELPIKDGFDMLGYDADESYLYVLLSKGYFTSGDKYLLRINIKTNTAEEIEAGNVLNMELMEFLVQDQKAIFLGSIDLRPVLQIYDLDSHSVHTVQGVYGNDTQVLQIRKLSEIGALEAVISRKGSFRNRELNIITYDLQGNILREIKVDQFGVPGQEILDGLLISSSDYQEVLIGAFGLEKRSAYQGMYIMDVNEFGEFDFKLYTLADFPNFYNYLDEKAKSKKDAFVLKELDKDKIPGIENLYTVRDVRQTEDAFYVYFDQYSVSNSRSGFQQGLYSPTGAYRYDRWSRMGSSPLYMDPNLLSRFPSQGSYQSIPVYQYSSAHFAKISKKGPVIWDNATSYTDFSTEYPDAFAEIAIVGDDLYHMYIEDLILKMSFFKNGLKVFENQEFEFELLNKDERIENINPESLRLIHWYDRYYLLSGTQRIRYLDEAGKVMSKEVYFQTKVLVDGDMYQPESLSD